jgi:hypothetical protein
MARKILTWGIVAGVVMFFWGFVSHTLLPIGEAGFRILPEDAALLESMAGKATEPGIYFYPRLDPRRARSTWRNGRSGHRAARAASSSIGRAAAWA